MRGVEVDVVKSIADFAEGASGAMIICGRVIASRYGKKSKSFSSDC